MQLICVDEQSFPQIREKSGVLVDKTRIMHDLFKDGKYFFISRPRRFGKSLLCSTLAALFSGKKDLFKGLWIEQSDWEWQEHPVIHLDMAAVASADYEVQNVRHALHNELLKVAKSFDLEGIQDIQIPVFFGNLLQALSQKTGKQVVVIIDEYDKPLLDVITHPERYSAIHALLTSTYGQLKKSSPYLRFVFLTGVFKFAKTSVFSGLNNLKDLTFDPKAAELLGYTEKEITNNFPEHLAALAQGYKQTVPQMLETLKEKYNGYRFGVNDMTGEIVGSVYNPFALNNVLAAQQLADSWFESATPTSLIKMLNEKNFAELDETSLVTSFGKLRASAGPDNITATLILFYAGYMTIKSYSKDYGTVALDFPNAEVSKAFSEYLLPLIVQKEEAGILILARKIKECLLKSDLGDLLKLLNQSLAQLPYHLFGTQESYYQTVFYLLLSAGNCVAITEDMMNRGRADITVLLPQTIYIFELKMNQPASIALEQIKDRDYAAKYSHLGRQIYLVGIELSNSERVVKDLVLEKLA